ncbi:xanthine dehydrogenase accessory protein XdhC [Vibrio cholerae]
MTNSPFLHSHSLSWLSACQQLETQGVAYCIATVIASVGSVPRNQGAKMVITESAQFDTLGGGNLEYQVIEKARQGLARSQSTLTIERFSLAADLGQCCGGGVQVMLEYFLTQTPHVVVFGAGHVGQALCRILTELPCQLHVADTRSEWLAPLEDTHIHTHLIEDVTQTLTSLPSHAYIVVMTQDHALDFDITRQALDANRFAFVGLIGSEGKKQRFSYRLKEQLADPATLEHLTCPIGHPDVKGKLPMQVAISVAAQLNAYFASHSSSPIETSPESLWREANDARQLVTSQLERNAHDHS